MDCRTHQHSETVSPAGRLYGHRETRVLRVRVDWRRRPRGFRTADGQLFLLLCARNNPCARCRFGNHWETLWGPLHGGAVRIEWCESCFNAGYDGTIPSRTERAFWQRLKARIQAGAPVRPEIGARMVVLDLERRGLLQHRW